MSSYNALVHKEGPDKLVVEEGGVIEIRPGAFITDVNGMVASINHISETEGVMSAEERQKFNDLLDTLEAIGILSTY